jgi:hypothetical protein
MIRLRRRHHTIRYNQTQLPPRQRGPATALIVALPGGVLVVWLLFTTILRWYGYGTERSIRDSLISNYGAGPDNWMVDGYTGHPSSEVANWRGRHIRHALRQGLPTVITTRRLSCGSLSNFTGPTS